MRLSLTASSELLHNKHPESSDSPDAPSELPFREHPESAGENGNPYRRFRNKEGHPMVSALFRIPISDETGPYHPQFPISDPP